MSNKEQEEKKYRRAVIIVRVIGILLLLAAASFLIVYFQNLELFGFLPAAAFSFMIGFSLLMFSFQRSIARYIVRSQLPIHKMYLEETKEEYGEFTRDVVNQVKKIPCSSCGYENDEDALFCNHCGSKLTKTCPHCSQENKADARFCKNCGEPL